MINEKDFGKPVSVWSDTCPLPKFPRLNSDIKTDVLIIGGGISGILCASMLAQAGVNYILAEADTICSGITKNTTAKITAQHSLIYHKLLKRFGYEKTALYLEANQKALNIYRELCSKIDCDFQTKDSFVYSLDNEKVLDDEMKALEKLGFCAEFYQELPLPFTVAGAVKFPGQAQFHPLKFIRKIAGGLNIYEHTAVRELSATEARTDHGTISADKIIVTTHFPFINKHGSFFIKMYQHRSYVIALENAPDLQGMYVDEASKGLSFRNDGEFLLIGGGGHRTGKKGGNWSEIRQFAAIHYPNSKIRYQWAAQDCMTLDDVPYIGLYSKNTPNFFTATGFNKWGMTSSMVSAMLLTDLVTEKENPLASLFSPSRTVIRPQLALNTLETAVNLLTPTVPRCPHLGCALKWNKAEHSWDCPCHGSRFDEDGSLIDNPATDDLKHL